MPQSLSVFAVSLQEHPELLNDILPLLCWNVNSYFTQAILFLTRGGFYGKSPPEPNNKDKPKTPGEPISLALPENPCN
jgi:hypothetical protein